MKPPSNYRTSSGRYLRSLPRASLLPLSSLKNQMKPNRNPAASAAATPLLLLCFFALYLVTTISPALFTSTSASACGSPYHSLFLSLSSNSSASSHLRRLTSLPHISSSDADSLAASYVLSSFPFPSHATSYSVLLTFPLHRSLSLLSPSSPPIHFSLTEIPVPSDPSSSLASLAVPTFHAYAHSGAVTAPLTYAYYGRVEDFDKLRSLGINVTGTVVLARYGKIFRGDIVKNSQDAGAAAVLVYSDYEDYAKGDTFPDGQWLPETGVQRGSTLRSQGDPTTPGWSCRDGEEACERVDIEEIVRQGFMPGVPSLPISGKDGEELHKAIGGQVAPDDWQGRQGAPVYHLGPGPGVVNLTYLVSHSPLSCIAFICANRGTSQTTILK